MLISEKLVRYNANSKNKNVGDCVKRGISLAYGIDYDEVSRELNRIKKEIGSSAFNSIKTVDEFIKRHGGSEFVRLDPSDYVTEEQFSQEHNTDTYLCLSGERLKNPNIEHMVVIHNGNIYDSWDSSNYYVKRYYKLNLDEATNSVEYTEFDKDTIKKFLAYIELCVENAYNRYSKFYKDKGWSIFDNSALFVNEARAANGSSAYADIQVKYYGDLKGISSMYYNKAYRFEISIPYTFNIRFTEDQVYKQIENVTNNYIERKLCWWMIDAQKEAMKYKDSYDRHGIQNASISYYDGRDKKIYYALPLWVRNLSTNFDVDNGRFWGERPEYTLTMLPLASDTNPDHENGIDFHGYTSKDIMSAINDYVKDPTNYKEEEW